MNFFVIFIAFGFTGLGGSTAGLGFYYIMGFIGAVGGGGGAIGSLPTSTITAAILTGAASAVGRTMSFGFSILTFFGGGGGVGIADGVSGVVCPVLFIEFGEGEGATTMVTFIFVGTTVEGSITFAGVGGAAGTADPSAGTTFTGFFGGAGVGAGVISVVVF